MIRRMFDGWAEMGMLPMPPDEAVTAVGRGQVEIPHPEVEMMGRLAMAIGRLSLRGAEEQLERLVYLSQFMPGILDNVDADFVAREGMRQNGAPAGILRTIEQRDQMRAAQAQAQQAQMAMQGAEMASKAVKNVGGVPEAKKLLQGAA